MHEFNEETEHMQAWYCTSLVARRIVANVAFHEKPGQPSGVSSVVNDAVRKHYCKLKGKVKQEGLWNWAKIASAIHEAGIPMHSGTVAVDRLWSQFNAAFPDAARRVCKEWFEFLSNLLSLRHNYLHFHSSVSSGSFGYTTGSSRGTSSSASKGISCSTLSPCNKDVARVTWPRCVAPTESHCLSKFFVSIACI